LERDDEDDHVFAAYVGMGATSPHPIIWVGVERLKFEPPDLVVIPHQTRLCNSPGRCKGQHDCDGVLGILKHETDIVILACRHHEKEGETPKDRSLVPTTRTYGRDEEHLLFDVGNYDEFVNKVAGILESDPAKAEELLFGVAGVDKSGPGQESFGAPQGSMGLLQGNELIRCLGEARYMRELAERTATTQPELEEKAVQFVGHLRTNYGDYKTIVAILKAVPAWAASIRNYLSDGYLRQEFQARHSEEALDDLSEKLGEFLAAVPAAPPAKVSAFGNKQQVPSGSGAGQVGGAQGSDEIVFEDGGVDDVDDLGDWEPTGDDERAAVALANTACLAELTAGETALRVRGGVVLFGKAHDPNAVDWVAGGEHEVGTLTVPYGAFAKNLRVIRGIANKEHQEQVRTALNFSGKVRFEGVPDQD
jgi:hypothetical protein